MISYFSYSTLAIWIATMAVQVSISVLILRGNARRYPAFRAYVYLYTLCCPATFAVAAFLSPMAYFTAYYVLTLSGDMVLFFVAYEIYHKVFGPRIALPRFVPERTAAMMAASFSAAIAFSFILRTAKGGLWFRGLLTVEQALTASAFAVFWILFSYSRILRIQWPPRLSAIWIGFTLYLTVDIAAVFIRAVASNPVASAADQTAQVSNLISVLWWAYAFRNQEKVVQPFTSGQVQQLKDQLGDSVSAMHRLWQ